MTILRNGKKAAPVIGAAKMSYVEGGIVLLTEGRPWKCILRFALPLFLGSLLQQMYYTVDAMMVGRLAGEQALSGLGDLKRETYVVVIHTEPLFKRALCVLFSETAGMLL